MARGVTGMRVSRRGVTGLLCCGYPAPPPTPASAGLAGAGFSGGGVLDHTPGSLVGIFFVGVDAFFAGGGCSVGKGLNGGILLLAFAGRGSPLEPAGLPSEVPCKGGHST